MLASDASLKTLLTPGKTIAIVGAKDRPGTDVDLVGQFLLETGFRVIPIHPARPRVWGLPTRRSLAEVEEPIDIVDLFRAAASCPGHAAEVLALSHRPACFWMQAGIASPEARRLLEPRGVLVVEDRCLMVEYRRLWR